MKKQVWKEIEERVGESERGGGQRERESGREGEIVCKREWMGEQMLEI